MNKWINLQTKYCKPKQQTFSLYENKVNSKNRASQSEIVTPLFCHMIWSYTETQYFLSLLHNICEVPSLFIRVNRTNKNWSCLRFSCSIEGKEFILTSLNLKRTTNCSHEVLDIFRVTWKVYWARSVLYKI